MKNSCEGVTDESAILAFIDNLERGHVTSQPFDQGGTSVLSAIPWINDSTTEQNEIFIA
jgi:hypothetical protein